MGLLGIEVELGHGTYMGRMKEEGEEGRDNEKRKKEKRRQAAPGWFRQTLKPSRGTTVGGGVEGEKYREMLHSLRHTFKFIYASSFLVWIWIIESYTHNEI